MIKKGFLERLKLSLTIDEIKHTPILKIMDYY